MLKKSLMLMLGALLLVGCGRKSYTELITAGDEFMNNNDTRQALEAYREALSAADQPDQKIEVATKLGDIFTQQLPNQDSAGVYYAVVLDYPDELNSESLRNFTKKIYEAGNYGAAVRGYSLWLERYSEDPLAPSMTYDLAELYHKHIRDLIRAVELYDAVAQKYSASSFAPKALFSEGYVYANELKNFDKARSIYQTFLTAYPEHEMVPSVEFELKYLGKTIEEIPELKHLMSGKTAETQVAGTGKK